LLTLPDEARSEAIARAVRLEAPAPSNDPRFLDLTDQLVIRDPPLIAVSTPLPCDLAHAVTLEMEGVAGRFEAGEVIMAGSGSVQAEPAGRRVFPLPSIRGVPSQAIDQPGERRLRAVLTADAHRGWADPGVRSVWPGTITTEWATVQVVRR
jgi:hypothetical protein